jgi:hypothetical protein
MLKFYGRFAAYYGTLVLIFAVITLLREAPIYPFQLGLIGLMGLPFFALLFATVHTLGEARKRSPRRAHAPLPTRPEPQVER